ncbi:MAG: hypothetical protein K9K75_02250 [Deltaproteobacteria bacterium]|nr:hypothetical protein [Deltaproteobacteria bacterium]
MANKTHEASCQENKNCINYPSPYPTLDEQGKVSLVGYETQHPLLRERLSGQISREKGFLERVNEFLEAHPYIASSVALTLEGLSILPDSSSRESKSGGTGGGHLKTDTPESKDSGR